jgi:hypothetical protein
MYNRFSSYVLLDIEARRAIELRPVCLAWGEAEGLAQAQSKVVEKVDASGETMMTLMLGSSPESVIARYRGHVAAITEPLSAA